jgi:enoyl-CoA hydratase
VTTASRSRIDEQGAILTVTIDRPAKLNAIDPATTRLLWDAVEQVRDRDDLRVLVIQAVGRYFSAGIDLTEGGRGVDAASGTDYRRTYRKHHLLYDEIEALEKPVVIAVQGRCLGAGLEMAVSCDFRLAVAAASFALPEIKLGVIAGSGGTSRLVRLVGPHWARWIAWAGKEVSAERALQIGLVHDVYPDEGFHDQVHEFAVELAALPTQASAVAKITIELSCDVGPSEARQIERLANTNLVFSAEHREIVNRFRQESAERRAARKAWAPPDGAAQAERPTAAECPE